MEQNIKYGLAGAASVKKKNYSYLFINVLLAIILPLLSVLWDCLYEHETFSWELIGKWFIFFAVGIRLFTAGISQASNPAFTGGIFKMKTTESFAIIRELGFANISLGVMGILSVLNNNWRVMAAVTGGLFLGLAGIYHLFKKPDSSNELIAMVYDLFALVIIILYLSVTLFF
ncbi:MAG TPA: DUF6790 family protein [Puia sp.]|nr:DUF6790 family protein [Puia sp.]